MVMLVYQRVIWFQVLSFEMWKSHWICAFSGCHTATTPLAHLRCGEKAGLHCEAPLRRPHEFFWAFGARKGWETWLLIRFFATGCHVFNQIKRGIFKLHPTKSIKIPSNLDETKKKRQVALPLIGLTPSCAFKVYMASHGDSQWLRFSQSIPTTSPLYVVPSGNLT